MTKIQEARTQSGTAERGELGRACEGSVCELKHTYLTPARRLHLQLACQLWKMQETHKDSGKREKSKNQRLNAGDQSLIKAVC